jgi:hypothetical protein
MPSSMASVSTAAKLALAARVAAGVWGAVFMMLGFLR